jgi:general secretion pathway protein G
VSVVARAPSVATQVDALPVVCFGHRRFDGVNHLMSLPPRPSADTANEERGFTLLELLVVLAILGLLIGLVAPAALRQLGSAKEKIAHQSIERLAGVLDIYKLDIGSYPTTEQGLQSLITQPSGVARWSGPYVKGEKVPQDPWGHPFLYRSPSQRPGHEYDLYSLGPGGQAGGKGEAAAIYNE